MLINLKRPKMSLATAVNTARMVEDAYEAGKEAFKSLPPGLQKGIKAGASRLRKKTKRSWDSYRKGQGPRFDFGAPVGEETTKRFQPYSRAAVPFATRTLYTEDLVQIPVGTSNQINNRQRGIINCRGISLYMNIRNNQEDAMYCNVAVIVPKYNQSLGAANTVDFFRGNGSSRGENFGTGLSGLEMHMLPINKDQFHILYHRRLTLAPRGPVAADFSIGNSMSNYHTIKKYIKVNRQLRYEGNNIVSGRIQLVYWFSDFDAVPTSAAEPNAVTLSEHHLVYFRDSI